MEDDRVIGALQHISCRKELECLSESLRRLEESLIAQETRVGAANKQAARMEQAEPTTQNTEASLPAEQNSIEHNYTNVEQTDTNSIDQGHTTTEPSTEPADVETSGSETDSMVDDDGDMGDEENDVTFKEEEEDEDEDGDMGDEESDVTFKKEDEDEDEDGDDTMH
ncbi:hypothetical protein BM1_01481 [Bipolaris maydis]|nr:hypothetical protein BM1_01481 [Bipolaris maydis]